MTAEPSNTRHGYALATWLQRLIAHVIDRVIVGSIVLAALFGLAWAWLAINFEGSEGDWGPFNGVVFDSSWA